MPVFPPGTENDPSPPILVNVGDLLSHWTNGYFKSVIHRVIIPMNGPSRGEDRYTIAYFGQPVRNATLKVVPSQVVRDFERLHGAGIERDGSMTAIEYLQRRLRVITLEGPKEEVDGGRGDEPVVVPGTLPQTVDELGQKESTAIVSFAAIASDHRDSPAINAVNGVAGAPIKPAKVTALVDSVLAISGENCMADTGAVDAPTIVVAENDREVAAIVNPLTTTNDDPKDVTPPQHLDSTPSFEDNKPTDHIEVLNDTKATSREDLSTVNTSPVVDDHIDNATNSKATDILNAPTAPLPSAESFHSFKKLLLQCLDFIEQHIEPDELVECGAEEGSDGGDVN